MALDLLQWLNNENPYGYPDPNPDMNVVAINDELAALRLLPTPEGKMQKLKELAFVDGPASAYSKGDPAPDAVTYEKVMMGLFWYFKGQQVRISKAVRFQYEVAGKKYNILIGFEGSGDGM